MFMPRVTVITSLFNTLLYLEGYFQAVLCLERTEEVEILLIHNAPQDEELAIVSKYLPQLPFVKHIIVPREGLYATWNRGVKMARGRYITNWNVDDIRLPDSLINQADALDQHPDAVLSYGDFVIVNEYGKREGRHTNEPDYDLKRSSFFSHHHIGCFPMWRRDLHDTIGYFDEQFKLVADLDFQIRVAKQYQMIKVGNQLGYYLEGTPNNLSSNHSLQMGEYTVVQLRYGNFNMLHLTDLFSGIKKIRVFQYKWLGAYHNMKPWKFKDYYLYIIKFPLIGISVLNFPRHFVRRLIYG